MDGTLFTMMSVCRRGWALLAEHRPQWVYLSATTQEGTRRPESAPQFPSLPVAAAGEDTARKLPVGYTKLHNSKSRPGHGHLHSRHISLWPSSSWLS